MLAIPSPKQAVALAAVFAALISSSSGDEPATPLDNPSAVTIEPATSTLVGRRATGQLLATGTYADGSTRDLTRSLEWSSLNPEVAIVTPRGQVVPKGDGEATLVARGGSVDVRASVKVEKFAAPAPVSFRLDVIPALSQAGCNMGACHGTPTGKGGFKLSLRGYMPDQDFTVLTHEAAGRRIDPMRPETSMLLRKPLGELPHEGGLRLDRTTKTYEYLRDWIAEGGKDDPAAPAAVALEIRPGARVLNAPATTQQVAVVVRSADGSTRDVTPLCYYNSSSPEIADVDASGFVTFKGRGEVAIIAHYLDLVANVRLTHLVDVPGFAAVEVPKDNPIDEAVFAKLNRMRIRPSEPCSDAEFIRRASLDTIGILPTPEEVKAFLDDPAADKRAKLVDRLLARPEFLDFWTLKFADILRSNGRLIQSKGTHVFQRWIRESLSRDKPMDQFVRELLTADGSTFQNPAANYYRISRDPESSVETTAQLFLGVRIQCAKCHNHPFERWTQDDYYGFAAFFSRVRQKKGNVPDEEVIFAAKDGDVRQPRTGKVMPPKALGGPVLEPAAGTDEDRRDKLAAWLTGAENPFFAKSLANRVWYHLMGRGVVEPVDDFRDSNPPPTTSCWTPWPPRSRRTGTTSRARPVDPHQPDLRPERPHQRAECERRDLLLARLHEAPAGRGPAGRDLLRHRVEHPVRQPAQGHPGDPAARRQDGEPVPQDVRPPGPRAGLRVRTRVRRQPLPGAPAHRRGHRQRQAPGRGRPHRQARQGDPGPEAIVRDLYLRAVSREPNSTELEVALNHLKAAPDRRQAVEDLGWALINSKEFLFRH